MDTLNNFLRTIITQLKFICEGRYDATDEVLKYSDTRNNEPAVSELAETVGLISVKLEAREMALEKTIEDLRQTLEYRKEFGSFFIVITFFIGVFMFISAFIDQSTLSPEQILTIGPILGTGFLIFLIILAVTYIRLSPFPLEAFGLTLKGSGRAIGESIIATIILIWLVTIFRLAFADRFPHLQGKPLLDTSLIGITYLFYPIIAAGQEFVARGVLQSIFFRLLGGKNAGFWSIILASLIFGVTHTYYSFWLAVLSVLVGFLWGWLYKRHQTIVGISISHLIFGVYLGLTGLWSGLI